MGEVVETMRLLKELDRDERAARRAAAPAALKAAGIQHTAHNSGAHIIVTFPRLAVVDFFPGPDRYHVQPAYWVRVATKRAFRNAGRGLEGLLAVAKEHSHA